MSVYQQQKERGQRERERCGWGGEKGMMACNVFALIKLKRWEFERIHVAYHRQAEFRYQCAE